MATPDFNNIRSLEDISNLLSILYFNMHSLEKAYYDIFINPTPMVVDLERYNENGILETIQINNRAKDLIGTTITGVGNPNGVVSAKPGVLYLDTDARALYYKAEGSDNIGWVLVWSEGSLVEGRDFLSPNGNGSGLTSLQANSIEGVLSVAHGGTSLGTLVKNAIYKGNNESAITTAKPSIDYMVPSDLTGMICWFPVVGENKVPNNWLYCDGRELNKALDARYLPLFNVIGYTYGGSGDIFKLPDLRNQFIRGWDGSRAATNHQDNGNKAHTHELSGATTNNTGDHTHTRGTMNITGNFGCEALMSGGATQTSPPTGAFSSYSVGNAHVSAGIGGGNVRLSFDASRSWTGSTSSAGGHTHTITGGTISSSGGDETVVDNYPMIPVIHI